MGYIKLDQITPRAEDTAYFGAEDTESALVNIIEAKVKAWEDRVSKGKHYLVDSADLSKIIHSLEKYTENKKTDLMAQVRNLVERAILLKIAIEVEVLKSKFKDINLMIKNNESKSSIQEAKEQVTQEVHGFYNYCMQQNMSAEAEKSMHSLVAVVLKGALELDKEWVGLLEQFSYDDYHEIDLSNTTVTTVAAWKRNQQFSPQSDARAASKFSGYAATPVNTVANNNSPDKVAHFELHR